MAAPSTDSLTSTAALGLNVETIAEDWPRLPAQYCEVRWYAAYTSAHHEKRVAEQLRVRGVEYFLPVYSSVRRWKDRRIRLDLPLFPGYVFVRIALRDRLAVLQLPGIARLVGFNCTPAALSAAEIETLRAALVNGLCVEPHPYLTVGRRVRVMVGPLAGMVGIVVRRKNRTKLVISFDLIERAMAVELEEPDLVVA